MGDGQLSLVGAEQGVGKVVVGVGEVGLEFEGRPKICQGLNELAAVGQGGAHAVVGPRVIRLDL